MRERGLGKLRKVSLSGRACGVRRQVNLVGRTQLATSTECWNKNPTIHPKGNRDPWRFLIWRVSYGQVYILGETFWSYQDREK